MRQRGPKRRYRTFPMLLLLALVALVVGYFRCGDDLGLGGGHGGAGHDERAGEPARGSDDEVRPVVGGADEKPVGRCKLRLDSVGLRLDGDRSTVDDAVTACKKAGGAELTVTGDAMFGERERIRQALDRAGVEVFVREGAAPDR